MNLLQAKRKVSLIDCVLDGLEQPHLKCKLRYVNEDFWGFGKFEGFKNEIPFLGQTPRNTEIPFLDFVRNTEIPFLDFIKKY